MDFLLVGEVQLAEDGLVLEHWEYRCKVSVELMEEWNILDVVSVELVELIEERGMDVLEVVELG